MKTSASQSTFVAISAVVLLLSASAQQTTADQKQSNDQQKPATTSQPTPKSSSQQPAGQPGSPGEKQQPAAQPKPEESGAHPAAAAAGERQPLLSQLDPSALAERKLTGTIRAATKNIERRAARDLEGRKVRGSDGKELGKVKDFLIDVPAGNAAYAVVSSGGIGVRDQLRLVPFKALEPGRKYQDEFTVTMNEKEWNSLGTLDEKEFESGHVTVSDGQRRDLAQRFERAQSGEAATGSAYYTQAISSHLVRAREIRGSDVFIAEKKVGTIEGVIIDEGSATASAIFNPSWRFTTAKEKFVVPLNRYAFGATKDERVTTTITRADFEQMRAIAHEVNPASSTSPPSSIASQPPAAGTGGVPAGTGSKTPAAPPSQQAASPSSSPSKDAPKDRASIASDQRPVSATSATAESQPPQKEEPELTPTGRTSADPKQSKAATESLSAAKAIRETFDREAATIAKIDVAVNPENGSIVLRGSVADEQLKKSIEEKAKQAAKGARIDSQIAVENKPASTPTPSVNSPAKEPAPTPPRAR